MENLNFYFKIFGSGLVIASGSLFGIWYARIRTLRIKQLRMLEKYIVMLSGEIAYGQTPLPDIFQMLSGHCDRAFLPFFETIEKNLREHGNRTFREIWEEAVTEGLCETSLLQEEKELLKKLGEGLSFTDCDTKQSVISLFLSELSVLYKELEGENRIRTRLSRILGVTGGLFLVILLI